MNKLYYWILFISLLKDTNAMVYNYTIYYTLCGCYVNNVTTHTLQCPPGEVIRIEGYLLEMKYRSYNGNYPTADRDSCQYNGAVPTDTSLSKASTTDRLAVYKNCTYKNSCTITSDGLPDGNKKLLYYPYQCENENTVQNISENKTADISNPVFYFSGQDYIGTKINCHCSVTSTGPSRLEIYFINIGPQSCSKINMVYNHQQLITCLNEGSQILYTLYNETPTIELNITDMEAVGDEEVFFKVYGYHVNMNGYVVVDDVDVDVNCTGCRTVSVPSTSTTKSSTLTTPTSKTSGGKKPEVSREINTKSSIQTSTSPTTPSKPAGINSVNSEALDEAFSYIYVLVGLLVVIIIINIVVGVFCFLRKRKNVRIPEPEANNQQNGEPSFPRNDDPARIQNNPPLQSNNDVYAHYQYIDHSEVVPLESTPRVTSSPHSVPEVTDVVKDVDSKIKSTPEYTEVEKDSESFEVQKFNTDRSLAPENVYSEPGDEDPIASVNGVDLDHRNPNPLIGSTGVGDNYDHIEDVLKSNNMPCNKNIAHQNGDESKSEEFKTYLDPVSSEMKTNFQNQQNKSSGISRDPLSDKMTKPIPIPQHTTDIESSKISSGPVGNKDYTITKSFHEKPTDKTDRDLDQGEDNYDHIGNSDRSFMDTSNNHVGTRTHDNYHHISPVKKFNSPRYSTNNYSHIGENMTILGDTTPTKSTDNEDNYDHIGNSIDTSNNGVRTITHDNYHHTSAGKKFNSPRFSTNNYSHVDEDMTILGDTTPTKSTETKNSLGTSRENQMQSDDLYENTKNIKEEFKECNPLSEIMKDTNETEDTYNHLRM